VDHLGLVEPIDLFAEGISDGIPDAAHTRNSTGVGEAV